MEYVIFMLIGFLTISFAAWALVAYAFKGNKCPECGEIMEQYFDEKTKSFYEECPNCGHKEEI